MQRMILIKSRLFCYPFLLLDEILNLLVWENQTSSIHLNWIISSYWILWSFMRSNKYWFLFESMHDSGNQQFFPYEKYNLSDRKASRVFYLHDAFKNKTRSSNLLEVEDKDYVDIVKKDWPQNMPLSNGNYQSRPLLRLRSTKNCNKFGSRSKWLGWRKSCAGITIKMLFQFWNQFIKDYFLPRQRYRYIKSWMFDCKPGQHRSREKKKCFTERNIHLMEKIGEMFLVVHSSLLHAKLLLMRLLFEKQQTWENHLLGLMLANYTLIQCVST